MKQQNDLQNIFLEQLKDCKIPIIVFLVNGFQIRGTLKSFDAFMLDVDVEGKQQMIYKHAVSTIVPNRPVKTM